MERQLDMFKYRSTKTASRAIIALAFAFLVGVTSVFAQEPTATPGVVNLSPLIPPTTDPNVNGLPSATPMPTQASLVRVEARDFANVRAEPSTEAAQLGTIRAGETYTVIGRYISWVEFQFPSAPNGRGWVYSEIVNVTGDLSTVPEIADPFGTSTGTGQTTTGSDTSGQAATQAILVQTPGALLVLTGAPILPGSTGVADASGGLPTTPRPTFTYPPGLVALAPTQENLLAGMTSTNTTTTSSTGTPPIVPIVVLGAIGLVGLAIGSLRRGG